MSELENEIDGLRSRNAELREAVEMLWAHCDLKAFGGCKPRWLLHALSTDCGKDYIHKDEVKPLVEVLECIANGQALHTPMRVAKTPSRTGEN